MSWRRNEEICVRSWLESSFFFFSRQISENFSRFRFTSTSLALKMSPKNPKEGLTNELSEPNYGVGR
ncbi:hypothetical protein J6590_052321 [Homalodisca vitripennis]|nr:hypothetical protein J6590_052321 [Homalodisca vitripennis]